MMHNKVLNYVSMCWDSFRCADKDEIKRIIQEVIDENPDETDWIKLGVKVKRRCIGEL